MKWQAMGRAAGAVAGVVGLAVGAAGCGSATSSASGSTHHVVITVQLQPNTGAINSPQNRVLLKDTQAWEKLHPGVTVKFLPDPYTNIADSNAVLITKASAHEAPDVVWEQYGQVGSLPKGILLNLKPWLEKPNPYASGNNKWLDTFESVDVPYMTAPNGGIYILLASDVATEIVYNKADFAKAGIHSTPTTWAQFIDDMAKLKRAGFTPLMFTDATGQCNPSWYERKFESELLHYALNQIDVNHAQVASGLDQAVGIERGIISMKNPAYAQGWKLLGQIRPYLAPGASSYGACSPPSASTPPLSTLVPFTQNKFAMAWMGSWDIPDLNQLGFAGKYGFFPLPTITKASAPSSANINVTGVVGGPNGTGEWSVTTQAADATMTPAKTQLVVNYLEYLYAPKNVGGWVGDAGNNSFIPLIKGAKYSGAPGIQNLVPSGLPPVTIDSVLDGSLTNAAQHQAARLLQGYLSGSLSYSQFATQWDAMLQSAAQAWAQQNHVNLAQYK